MVSWASSFFLYVMAMMMIIYGWSWEVGWMRYWGKEDQKSFETL